MSGSIDFEGRPVPIEPGDTVASALYRAGVRTFTRSVKHHRRRGLYCLSGDCPSCTLTVDGEPGVRSCVTEAADGMRVEREAGFPSAEIDVLAVTDLAHPLMPVGFYHKTFIRPAFAWPLAEKVISRATGVGRLLTNRAPRRPSARHVHTDLLVIGGGVAGLAAAIAGSDRGERVVLCEELRTRPNARALERHTAVGVYEGPLVPVVGPEALLRIHPERVVVATGASQTHSVFRGNDLPGVFLGRGAARLAGRHGVRPGERAVLAASSVEGFEHLEVLRGAGVDVVAVLIPEELADLAPRGLRLVVDGRVAAAEGRRAVRAARVTGRAGSERFACDAIVLSLGLTPRDALLRMGAELPVVGAGDVVLPGCTIEEAVESGRRAAGGGVPTAIAREGVVVGRHGYVCLCEDVSIEDLERAWDEGWHSSEILKRYTTATMGPCQGAMCGRVLASFVTGKGGTGAAGGRTTARPPARTHRLEDLAAGVHEVIDKRTGLHGRHLELGAHLAWSGSWKRPFNYGDAADEYRAVRERVSLMDVGTLGKFLVAGADAAALVDQIFPCRIDDLVPGRSRYLLALDEAGYVMDDGLVCALDDGYYLTSTSGGADRMEAWLRNWIDRWDLHAHVVNQTAMLGAINVAGPRARELLSRLSGDPLDRDAIAYPGHGEITVAGVPCRAIAVGFVGELAFELHHPRSRSVELWDALLDAGADLGIRPHGLDALEILRMEKGHVYLGQDTLPDDHPGKLGLGWAVAMDKPTFLGKVALQRMAEIPIERKLVGLTFEGAVPQRGVPLYADGRIVGRVTSCGRSEALGRSIGLGWLRAIDGTFPASLRAGNTTATVTPTPFYDPEGVRLRA
jgi:sarcosine oxidase, subunit alpha